MFFVLVESELLKDQVKMIVKRVTGIVNLMTHSCVSRQSVCTGASQILVIITRLSKSLYLGM